MGKKITAVVGGFILLWNIIRGGIGVLGDVDFVVEKTNELGWMEDVLVFLLNPPSETTLVTILVGFVMLGIGLKKGPIFIPKLPKTEGDDYYLEKRGVTDNPDTQIWEAIAYIAEESRWHDKHDEYLSGAARELRREAIAGNIIIWGKRSISMVCYPVYTFSDVHTTIDRYYWLTNKIHYLPTWRKSIQAIADTIPEAGREGPCYIDLMVNKRQVKRLWSRKRSIIRKRFLL